MEQLLTICQGGGVSPRGRIDAYAKILGLVFLLPACQNCRTIPPAVNTQIYVFAGQSNNAGFAAWTAETPDNRIRMFKNRTWSVAVEPTNSTPGASFGNSVSFGREMLRMNPSTPIGIINCSVGSTIIDQWAVDGVRPYTQQVVNDLAPNGLMQNCYDMVSDAIAADPTAQVAGLVFMQGESDANVCGANSPWASGFTAMVGKFRLRYAVPVVYGQIGHFIPDAPQCNTEAYMDTFRDEQASVRIDGVAMVITKDLSTDSGGVHFDTMAQQTLGGRFAQAMFGLQKSGRTCSEPWWSRIVRM